MQLKRFGTELNLSGFPKGEFNKDYQETSSEVSQIPNGTSDNPDIKSNLNGGLPAGCNEDG